MKNSKPKVRTVDKYEKYAEIDEIYASKRRKLELSVPGNFRMLCAILSIKPEDILCDFMRMASHSVSDRSAEKQHKAARKFFLACGFGQPNYSEKDIEKMFGELKAVQTIYHTTDDMDWNDKELFWKNHHMYIQHWFKHWFEKHRRQDDVSVLEKY
jgi:hypothetical protein